MYAWAVGSHASDDQVTAVVCVSSVSIIAKPYKCHVCVAAIDPSLCQSMLWPLQLNLTGVASPCSSPPQEILDQLLEMRAGVPGQTEPIGQYKVRKHPADVC